MAFTVEGALKGDRPRDALRRGVVIGLITFLTLIDLFGSQALLPQLIELYQVDAATMGFAVNASTIGMAISGLTVAWFSDRIDRRKGLWISLALLSVPTFALAFTTDTTVFMILRILQGVFMAAAFTLTMTFLSESCSTTAAAWAMSAYITGNVASNLFGRLMAASLADLVGVSGSFIGFAILNLAGALLAYRYICPRLPLPVTERTPPLKAWMTHIRTPKLAVSFILGFILLFVFVGVFTYVNLELLSPRIGLDPALLGIVYFVFVPSLITTLLAGEYARKYGARVVFWGASIATLAGLALVLSSNLSLLLAGLAIIGAGLFFAQAAATGFVGRTATSNHAAANGLYLTSYYIGGIAGSLVVGALYSSFGWTGAIYTMAAAMMIAIILAFVLAEEPKDMVEK